MPASRRKNLLAGRRRRQDDGEEDESVAGELQDDSQSEGSVDSHGDGEGDVEGSDSSEDEHHPAKEALRTPGATVSQDTQARDLVPTDPGEHQPKSNGASETLAHGDATLQGAQEGRTLPDTEELHFDDLASSTGHEVAEGDAGISKTSLRETPAQRSRREHQESIKQRNTNPAFVPTRGGFFLHDDRTSMNNGSSARMFGRGRGRGFAPAIHAG